MWSGPRNLSTAMMRAFESRGDCAVTDEPLYAHYLARTGIQHPGAAEVMASQPTRWQDVVAELVGPVPGGKPIWYQKHMTHHLLPDIERGWMGQLTHCFLIRDPARVVASYARKREHPTLEDIGFEQQAEIFRYVTELQGRPPLVVSAEDVLADPRGTLTALCDRLGVAFSERMLSWAPGLRATDGVWATHWYDGVEGSTGFRPLSAAPRLLAEQAALAAAAGPYHRELYEHRVRAS
jgi:hypothetical protein